jgi:hypothetical protein
MKKSFLTALGLALGLAFSAPLVATTSANAAGTSMQSGTQAAQPMTTQHHKKKVKKHHTSSYTAPSTTKQKKS